MLKILPIKIYLNTRTRDHKSIYFKLFWSIMTSLVWQFTYYACRMPCFKVYFSKRYKQIPVITTRTLPKYQLFNTRAVYFFCLFKLDENFLIPIMPQFACQMHIYRNVVLKLLKHIDYIITRAPPQQQSPCPGPYILQIVLENKAKLFMVKVFLSS